MARYLYDCYETSKNNRARGVSIDQINRLFLDYGIDIVAKKPGKKQLLVNLYKVTHFSFCFECITSVMLSHVFFFGCVSRVFFEVWTYSFNDPPSYHFTVDSSSKVM